MSTGKKIVVSLFDYTGNFVRPWADNGFDCFILDVQHKLETSKVPYMNNGSMLRVNWDLSTPWLPPFDREDIAFVAAFPPCDHLAVSGARWMKGKGLRRLSNAIKLFASAAEFCEWSKAPYFIENPMSTISTYWRKPDYTFDPCNYSLFEPEDHYTKKTCLWVGGGFVMPPKQQGDFGEPDDRIHKAAPSPERSNFRSQTPMGFARAVYESNCANYKKTA